MAERPLPTPRRRPRLALDLLVAVWVVIWILMALRVGHEVRDIGRIGTTVGKVGAAVQQTGATLETFGELPVLGQRIAEAGTPIREAGESASQSAASSRRSANNLSWMLGLSIALVPTLPLLVLYVPERARFERERRAVSRALRAGMEPGELQRALALRAVAHVSFDRLLSVSNHPNEDIVSGHTGALARAELERLHLRVPEPWQPGPDGR